MEFEKVRNIIAEQFGIGIDKITEATSFTKDLNADSLDVFQLITAIEEEFDIELQGEDVEKVATVGDVVSSLKKYMK